LLGQASVTGFGLIGASNAIVANVTNNFASARTNTGTATAVVYSAAGFSSIDTATSTPLGSSSTTINGLAPANIIVVDSHLGGGNIGAVTVNDAAGSSTILTFTTSVTTSSTAPSLVTLNGDWEALVTVNAGQTVTLASLNDGGATATLTDLILFGNSGGTGNLIIQSVSDSALATVRAGNANGTIILGGDNGITAAGSPLSQAHLTVNGPGSADTNPGTGTMTVYASGAGDVFNFGTSAATSFHTYSGGNMVFANGAGDVFNLGTAAATTTYSGTDTVNAAGAGDHFTVGNAAHLGTTFNLHAAGAGDVFTLNGGTVLDGGTTGAVTHGIGANDVITISTASATTVDADAVILLTGTVTGATSAGSFAFTTITGATGNDTLVFGNATNESGIGQINVAAATSLANALDIAAATAALSQQAVANGPAGVIAGHTGVVDWFQFGGNTYVVEAMHAGTNFQNNVDVVVKLVGLVDLSHASLNNAAAPILQINA
jgi:S-layer protein